MTQPTRITVNCDSCESTFEAVAYSFGSRTFTPRSCQNCSDERERQNELDVARTEAAEHTRRVQRRRDHSGLPPSLDAARLDLLDDEPVRRSAMRAARDLVAGNGTTLVLLGPVGTGKSTIAAATANALLEHIPVRWVSVPKLVAGLDTRFGSDEREDALHAMQDATALVLDDFDKARSTEQIAMHLFTAIDVRTAAGVPLIVTANLALAQLAKRWPHPHGQAIASRLASGAVCKVDGRDRRLDRSGA